jgi:hypothetical protein
MYFFPLSLMDRDDVVTALRTPFLYAIGIYYLFVKTALFKI